MSVHAEVVDVETEAARALIATQPVPIVDSGSSTTRWQRAYALRVAIADFVVITLTVYGAQFFWLGTHVQGVLGASSLSYSMLSLLLIVGWYVTMALYGTRSPRLVGYGAGEYTAIIDCTLRVFGLIAIVSYLAQVDISRGYILFALPVGVIALLLTRWLARVWLARQRKHGRMVSRVMLVGDDNANLRILSELQRHPEAGFVVVGACTPTEVSSKTLGDTSIPIVGSIRNLPHVLGATSTDTVIVSGESGLSADRVRELSWQLEAGKQHLIVAPNLTDIGGPRIHTRPVAGLPLIHVETPRYTGRQIIAKRAFDIAVSGILLVLLSWLFLIVSVLVKFSGKGPVFYRQERIGLDGVPFQMIKFRSMVVDADAQLAGLLAEQGSSDQPLFKVDNDPRVTRIGRYLRKFSIDEFPQLVNVFLGSMSLVGPRPQREGEVALYDNAARRRLIVKPGMSGLWQVSGRSSLSWEDAIRLDLYYVENWSLTGDIAILLRTFRAVFAPGETAH